ncbi:hypothetical protein Q9233_001103 [Columba guinea]|nr:hypothetical protein Q9233_001103 [Columba guinea]
MLMFEELSDIFSDCDNFATSRELLLKGVTQGTVPYLGTFLTDLVMLDTALQDYLEGGLINFEKRRREFEVIAQIKLLQSSCNSYCMSADEKFVQWFRRQRHLSDEESFRLSREIEGAADKSVASAKAQKGVVKRFSLPFLGLGVSAHSTPVNAQPKPAPGGSSGDSTVTIVPPTDTAEEPQHKCSKKCPDSVTPVTTKEVPPVLPLYNQQNGESCIIRTSVEEDRSGNIYRSILAVVPNRVLATLCLQLTNQEKAPAVIQRALEKHSLQCGSAQDYELVQIISEDKDTHNLFAHREFHIEYRGYNSTESCQVTGTALEPVMCTSPACDLGPTKEDVDTPEYIEETPERVEKSPERVEESVSKTREEDAETPECIQESPEHTEQTVYKTREEDAETTSKVSDEDAETPEHIENSLSNITEEDTETAECTEETPGKPAEEDMETPQSLEDNSTTEDGAEDAQEGAVDCDTLRRAQIHQTDCEGARWLGAEGDQLPTEHTVSPDETCKSRALKAGTLEKLVETLPMAFADNDFTYINTFLSTYRAFASTSTVLELLLDR